MIRRVPAPRRILAGLMALGMLLASVYCVCSVARPAVHVAHACCDDGTRHRPLPGDPATHSECPHCGQRVVADAGPTAITKTLAIAPVLFVAVPPVGLETAASASPAAFADAPAFASSDALPSRLHCALVL